MKITTDQIRHYITTVKGPARTYERLRSESINSVAARPRTQASSRLTSQLALCTDGIAEAAALMNASIATSGLPHLPPHLVEDENRDAVEALSATELIDLAQIFLSNSHGFHDLFDVTSNSKYRGLGGAYSNIASFMLELAQER